MISPEHFGIFPLGAGFFDDRTAGGGCDHRPSAPIPPRYSEDAISNFLKQIGEGPDRKEIETNLREAQRLEAKRASEPPNHVWVDPLTRLPIAAKIDGQLVTYTYKRLTELPQLPKPFQEAILAKFGKVPEF